MISYEDLFDSSGKPTLNLSTTMAIDKIHISTDILLRGIILMDLEGKYVYLMLLSYLMLKLTMEKLMF